MLTKGRLSLINLRPMINRKSFKTRLLLLVFLPLIVIAYLTVNQAYITYTSLKHTESVESLITFSKTISNLIHEIQKERGLSAGFIGAEGKEFKQQLIEQQLTVDSKLKATSNQLKKLNKTSFDSTFDDYINNALTKTVNIDEKRTLILSNKMPFEKSIKFYNKINDQFLMAIGMLAKLINDSDINRQLVGYHAFLLVKESAGIERAVLAHAFSQNLLANNHYVNFISLLSAQKSYLNLSLVNSDEVIKEYYATKLNPKALSEVERIRGTAINSLNEKKIDIDPNYWFVVATKQINLLKDVEDYFIAHITNRTNELTTKDRSSLILTIAIGGGLIFCMVYFSRQNFNNLTESFNSLVNKIKKHHKQKLDNFEQTLISFVEIIENRDAYTAGHTKRVAYYSELIAKQMGYSDLAISKLKRAALLDDIGKIQTPDNILLKPAKLTRNEFELMKGHSTAGYNILKDINMYKSIASIMRFHHERFDGKGYPDGLQGNEIPPLSRILIVTDAFDAMTTSRIYKPRKTITEALQELIELSEIQFHPEVVNAATIALREVECVDSIHQNPLTVLEKERFSYFYKDQLTNCYNKKFYLMKLDEGLNSNEFKNRTTITLRNFGLYNDTFSWDKGDMMLTNIANFLLDTFDKDLVFRIEGDDFKVFHREALTTKFYKHLCEQLEALDDSGILIIECQSIEINVNSQSNECKKGFLA